MDSFWGNIFRRRTEPGMSALLRGVPIFEGLSARELGALEPLLHRRTYGAGEVIFRQGDPGLGMYVIGQGRVGIDAEETSKRLVELTDGEFFGEIALLNETPRSATARALSPCVLFGLFQPDLLDLVRRRPRLGVTLLLSLAQIAGQRLIAVDAQVADLRRRLAACEGTGPSGASPPPNGSTSHTSDDAPQPHAPAERTVD